MKQLSFILLLIPFNKAICQKFPFVNFSVDKGLSQSQVIDITQDDQKHLWVGTFGGLNRFDGTSFKLFTKKDGLNSNNIDCIYKAKNGMIWIGTPKGISCYNGYKFVNYAIDGKESYHFIKIIETFDGTLYALESGMGLVYFSEGKFKKVNMPFTKEPPTCMYADRAGRLWVYIYKEGFYILQNNQYQKRIDFTNILQKGMIKFVKEYKGFTYGITSRGIIFKIYNDSIIQQQKLKANYVFSSEIDIDGNIWLGTPMGLQIYDGKDLSLKRIINASNGLSDNYIINIFKDKDGNIWLGTDGDGLFRYNYGQFNKYEKSNGLQGNLVMGLALSNKAELLLGTREGGLFVFNDATKKFRQLDYSQFSNSGVNCIGTDSLKNIYIGTMDSRLLKMENDRFVEIKLMPDRRVGIFSIVAYQDGILVNTFMGAYIVNHKKVERIPGYDGAILSALPMNNGNVIFGGTNGLYLFSKGKIQKLNLPQVDNSNVTTLTKYNDYIIIGSNDGLYFWDIIGNKILTCNIENGLSDNNVFAVLCDSKNNIWVGTSSAVQQVLIDKNTSLIKVKPFSLSDGYERSETNLNAITEDKKGNVWVGTTKGAFIHNNLVGTKDLSKPYIVIQNVDISKSFYNQNISWTQLPLNPEIEYKNNSISFHVKAIYMSNPEAVSYSYQLVGVDTGFSTPSKQSSLNYKNLEPGNYVLKVKAITDDGAISENTAEYSFIVVTPFYKSTWFKFLITFGLILTGIIAQLFYTKAKARKLHQIKIIKEQEQQKLREQTAEDFHDELGNKLTRISVLTDVLQSKIDKNDEDKRKIINQIQVNTIALYTGTKEIIWSLAKESDNLKEILLNIRQTGNELFSETSIEFEFIGIESINKDIKIPTGFNRNIIMILKELFTNTIRHAKATKVLVDCRIEKDNVCVIDYMDNGVGFDEATIKKGNGLFNISRRAEKINAVLTRNSIKDVGTTCSLFFKLQSS